MNKEIADVVTDAPTTGTASWTQSDVSSRLRAGDVLVHVDDWQATYTSGSGLRGRVRLGLRRLSRPSFRLLERDPRDGDLFDSMGEAQLYALNAGRIGWLSERPIEASPTQVAKATAASRGKYRTSRR